MGIYACNADDIIDDFEEFLSSQDGDVGACAIAKAWNKLAKKHGWKDKLYYKANGEIV